jgi:two-component system, response regulator, stage 0 sporulation protein F
MNEKLTVLYVDDEPLNLMLFEKVFRFKYRILTARSGEEGLNKIAENKHIHVVLSDMKMPGMTGIQFIRQAKERYPERICFVLTGYEITDDIAEALENKIIDGYFRKPYNFIEIDNAILNRVKM